MIQWFRNVGYSICSTIALGITLSHSLRGARCIKAGRTQTDDVTRY